MFQSNGKMPSYCLLDAMDTLTTYLYGYIVKLLILLNA